MFIRYYLDLANPFGDVDSALLAQPEAWVPGLARDAEERGEHLLAEVGFAIDDERRLGKRVEIEFGEPYRIPSKTVLPMAWKPIGAGQLFPAMDADLEVAALGPNRTQLSISARYRPPMGAVTRSRIVLTTTSPLPSTASTAFCTRLPTARASCASDPRTASRPGA